MPNGKSDKETASAKTPIQAVINALDIASDAWIVVYSCIIQKDGLDDQRRAELRKYDREIVSIKTAAREKMEQAVNAGNGDTAREWIDALTIIDRIGQGATLAKEVYGEAAVFCCDRPK